MREQTQARLRGKQSSPRSGDGKAFVSCCGPKSEDTTWFLPAQGKTEALGEKELTCDGGECMTWAVGPKGVNWHVITVMLSGVIS